MGVSFCLYRPKAAGRKKAAPPLPAVEVNFAITEYPRFLAKLAQDAGLGESWSAFTALGREMVDKTLDKLSGPDNPPSLETDPELVAQRQEIAEAQARLKALQEQEPLMEFLLAPWDYGEFGPDSCRRLAPRLRAIAENWQPAEAGWVGWREKALALADAMDFVTQNRGVVLAFT